MNEALKNVLQRLENVKKSGDGWIARCPAHEDQHASLSIGTGKDGRVLLKCHAGCQTADICSALGIEMRDLFAGQKQGVAARRESNMSEEGIVSAYDYRDEGGNPLFQVVRFRDKQFRQRRSDGNGGWTWGLDSTRRVPYRLPELLASDSEPVFITEGEKDADRLASLGLVATTNACGAMSWRDEYAQHLKDRDVMILPDNDDTGREHAGQVAASAAGVARCVKIVPLPDVPEKGDVSDWLDAGHTKEDLLRLVEDTPTYDGSSSPDPGAKASESAGSQADRLVSIVLDVGIELFHDDRSDAYARIPVGDHWETWRCRGRAFKDWVCGLCYQTEGKAPRSEAITSALSVLCAQARFKGDEHFLFNRVARYEEAIWYDLADRDWRAIRIIPGSWTLVNDPPILFRRYAHQRAQVAPIRGGNLSELLQFVKVPDHGHQLFLLVYLVSCCVPDIPHPIPDLHGSQGSGKTTLFRMLRRLIDPSATETLSFPRNTTELVQQLSHHWAAFFDNVTRLGGPVSDVLCRAVTGEGFSKRELWTNDEDIIYEFRRCIGLNGINICARKPDLLDRCILFGLDAIESGERLPEKTMWQRFEEKRPALLGAVFDALAQAMSIYPSVTLDSFPRMADFAVWGCAIAQALGYSQQDFLDAYHANISSRNDEIINDHPVAIAVMALMAKRDAWDGTPTQLLATLEELSGQEHIDNRSQLWPKAANILTRRLNEIKPNLAAAGIRFEKHSEGHRRQITLRKGSNNTVNTVGTVREPASDMMPRGSAIDAADAIAEVPSALPSGSPVNNTKGFDGTDASDGILGDFTQEDFEERVAVKIYDGGLSEEEARRLTVEEFRAQESQKGETQ